MNPAAGKDAHPDQPAAAREPKVVVGVDGSEGSRAALVHALTAAARRGAGLQVIATFSSQPVWARRYPLDTPTVTAVRADTESRARALFEEVSQDPAVTAVPGAAEVRADLLVTQGAAAQVLVDASVDADLLVVGSRGRGAVRSTVLGSVALHCLTHAACPVAVVHPRRAAAGRAARVVVGVDGSDLSRAALAAGIEEAARLGAEVAVVTTFERADYWTDLSSVVVPSLDEVRTTLSRGAQEMVEGVLTDRRGRDPEPAPTVRVTVTEGPPADVLVRAAEDADLLVIGSRGHGQLRGLLLGSVALACAMRGPCPVLVVHPRSDRGVVPGKVAESVEAGA
jgi:nucleotide-binding universal stress UspA family protein